MPSTHNTYHLPIAKSNFKKIVSDPQLHSGFLEHALDFLVPEGTPVLAALAGEVIEVKTDSAEGGYQKKYMGNQYLNWITLKHAQGEHSQYAHIKHHGALVKKGDVVCTGDVIGYSGNTGFSTCPHLHFQVYQLVHAAPGWYTRQVAFAEPVKVLRNKYRIIYEVLKFKLKSR